MLDQVTVSALAFDGSFNFMANFSRHGEDRCWPRSCSPSLCLPLPQRDGGSGGGEVAGAEGRALDAE